ncbi:hypothetical protein [Bifidobacterium callitrichidarum]|uniref:Uncharacterized protein n=1 Tax=Bifidobacterium callitrichidarum TaxID=2052941 RepID=A0A2U2N9J3_9BIFI|nr:hypothetical protein [Bifidobacterium callitrichidarum]PWG65654.1 hypothetical protein DF196_06900 [Bifidobacterium callitrichidarum]
MNSSIQHLEKELDDSVRTPGENQNPDETETVAMKATGKKPTPQSFQPSGVRKRKPRQAKKPELPVAEKTEEVKPEPVKNPTLVDDPYGPKPLEPATFKEMSLVALPTILGAAGLVLLTVVSLVCNQFALAIILGLSVIGLIGWRICVFDWTPVTTLVRSIEDGYGFHVLKVIQDTDVTEPVKLIHTLGRYIIWYSVPGNPEIKAANLLITDGRITLMATSNDLVIPSAGQETVK